MRATDLRSERVLSDEDHVRECQSEHRAYDKIEQLTVPELKLIFTYMKLREGSRVPSK